MFVSIVFVDSRMSIDVSTINFLPEFNSLAAIFSSVSRRYLNDIFYNRLNVKNIIKFIVNFFFVVATNAIDFFDTRSFLNLFCVFNIYIFIVLSFVLYLTIK